MKKEIHPNYVDCEITCVCGNSFKTKSIKESMKIDICSNCHPFFTESEKLVDSFGRVDKFKKRYAQASK